MEPNKSKRPSRAKQDEVTRRKRLNDGRCPTHGTILVTTGLHDEEAGEFQAECARGNCDFKTWVKLKSKIAKAMGH